MKSAYELAMEKLNQSNPSDHQPLTEDQKQTIQAIKDKFRAKIAERETFLGRKLLEEQNPSEAEQIRLQIVREKQRLNEDMEMEINKIYKEI